MTSHGNQHDGEKNPPAGPAEAAAALDVLERYVSALALTREDHRVGKVVDSVVNLRSKINELTAPATTETSKEPQQPATAAPPHS